MEQVSEQVSEITMYSDSLFSMLCMFTGQQKGAGGGTGQPPNLNVREEIGVGIR